jgi:acetyl-CoA carboxylase biotin carboxyl carrier protein
MPAGIATQEEYMGLTHEDVERILRLIDESGYEEVRIEHGDLKVHVRRGGAGIALGPAAEAQPAAPPARKTADTGAAASAPARPAAPGAPAAAQIPAGAVVVKAPMLGTFYRAPSPGAPAFVEIGSEVHADTTVCLIEVMKLFNTLKAGVEGRVAQILVENAAMVEYDQALIVIEPRAAR